MVRRVPTADEVAALEADFPGTMIDIQVVEGQRLSSLPEQDSYSYALALVWMGADSAEQLLEHYDRLSARLPFEFDQVEG